MKQGQQCANSPRLEVQHEVVRIIRPRLPICGNRPHATCEREGSGRRRMTNSLFCLKVTAGIDRFKIPGRKTGKSWLRTLAAAACHAEAENRPLYRLAVSTFITSPCYGVGQHSPDSIN